MERVRRRGLEVALGLGLSTALLLGVVLVYQSFSGSFSSDIHVSAQIAQAGDALEQGDIVTYRNVIVGDVGSAEGDRTGGARLVLRLHRDKAAVIPAGVTAVAVPATIFGATEIDLLPPADTSGPRLHDGAVVAADRSPAAESLQTALANAYTLLTSVHPAQLDAALSALATALQGQGAALGRLVDQADAYLQKLVPMLPDLDTAITSFATVTRELARNAPALLSSVSNLLTVSKGILSSQQAVAQLFNVAPTALDNAQLLLNQTNVNNAVTVISGQQAVLAAFAANPHALPQTIDGFKAFADTFATAASHGPYLKVNIILTGANLAMLFNVAAGQQGHVFDSVTDPVLYGPADCPRYPGLAGPNCGSAAAPSDASVQLLTTGPGGNGTVGSVGSPAEVAAAQAAASQITGVPQDQIPPAVDLLMGPLLRGAVTVVR